MDDDSSILTRYGTQQGAKKSYNPAKRGRASFHTIMAFVPDVKLVANLLLRNGDSSSSENLVSFLEDTFQKLRSENIGLLRLFRGGDDSENRIKN